MEDVQKEKLNGELRAPIPARLQILAHGSQPQQILVHLEIYYIQQAIPVVQQDVQEESVQQDKQNQTPYKQQPVCMDVRTIRVKLVLFVPQQQ